MALTDIVAAHGGRTPAEAIGFVGELKATGRYQADVY
jgi:sulfite reductase alpha subunit-like flavoprotein